MIQRVAAVGLSVFFGCAGAHGQMRAAEWNVTNYSSGRVSAFQTSIYGEFEGRSMSPDFIVGQEFLSQTGVDNFVALLNSAPGSPGDWAAAPFVDGPDTDNAFFYRTSRVNFLGMTIVAFGGVSPNHPRNVNRYDIRPVGYDAPETTIACYSTHMKAGSGSADQARRLVEAQRIRDDAATLPEEWHYLVAGDFNIQSSNQAAYQEMISSARGEAGRFFDPILTPGSWNNNGNFRIIHTQDPVGAGGMDDRHDQILLSISLLNGEGLDYIGDATIPYSTTTWNDPNHSYRSWGNDGTSFDVQLRTVGNTMVGPVIAQALRDAAAGQGHLPVILDLRLPSRLGVAEVLDFGTVQAGAGAMATLMVENAGDVALWSEEGIDDLVYELVAPAGFDAPAGVFIASPGAGAASHAIIMSAMAPGPVHAELTVLSNAPDSRERTVKLIGMVVGGVCPADLDGDGSVGAGDLAVMLGSWGGGMAGVPADLDGNGEVDSADLATLLGSWGPCP